MKSAYTVKSIFPYLSVIFFLIASQANAQKVGINTTSPQSTLDINGKVKVGDDNEEPIKGNIRFNNQTNDLEGYDGARWYSLTRTSTGITSSNNPNPNEFIMGTDVSTSDSLGIIYDNGGPNGPYQGQKDTFYIVNNNPNTGVFIEFTFEEMDLFIYVEGLYFNGEFYGMESFVEDSTLTLYLQDSMTVIFDNNGLNSTREGFKFSYKLFYNTRELEPNPIGWETATARYAVYGGEIDTSSISLDSLGLYSLQYGVNSYSTGYHGVSLGESAISRGDNSMAFGKEALAISENSFALGNAAKSSGNNSTAIGTSSLASGSHSTAIGRNAQATDNYSIALGQGAQATSSNSLSMGNGAFTTQPSTIAIGNNSSATRQHAIAFGRSASSSGLNSMAIGYQASATKDDAYALGYDAKATGNGSLALGYEAEASQTYAVAIGRGTKASGLYSMALGGASEAKDQYSLATGYFTKSEGFASTSMGQFSNATGARATALGYNTKAWGDQSFAVGYQARATMESSNAIGRDVAADEAGSLILGDGRSIAYGSTNSNTAFANMFHARFTNYRFYTGTSSSTVGVQLTTGANSWSSLSDKTKKENFEKIDGISVLNKLYHIPLTTWNYIGQDPSNMRHYGIMAQDFYENFGKDSYGEIGCDTLVNPVDLLGVAYVAIQTLDDERRKMKKENDNLKAQNAKLEERLHAIEQLIDEDFLTDLKAIKASLSHEEQDDLKEE